MLVADRHVSRRSGRPGHTRAALSLVSVLAMVLSGLALVAAGAPAQAAATPGHSQIVSPTPASFTPGVDNGQVNGIAQVGSTMVIGGTFSSVTPQTGGSTPRSRAASFDASTGALRAFNPQLNGDVNDVLAGPTSDTVYLAGSFTQLNGAAASHLVLVNVNTGAPVAGFRAPPTNGAINTLAKAGNRLLLGGNFTLANNVVHNGLASVNPTTGAIDAYMDVNVAGHHNDTGSGAQGAIGVRSMDATADGAKLVAVGNFKTVDGQARDQLVVIRLDPSDAYVDPTWRTRRYEPYCFSFAFDTYMRGVSVSPDGTYFVVSATGGHNANTLCDTSSRFDLGVTGDAIQPVWSDDAGGDTMWSAEVTEQAVYVGGHARWMNNSDGSDFAGQGAVPRPGLAALDVESGLPVAWNPGRLPRGAAVFAILATPSGVWIGSDTDYIGNYRYRRPKLAYFPLAGGYQQASDATPGLPGTVYQGGPRVAASGNVLYRVNAGGGEVDAVDSGPVWTADDGADSPYRNSGTNAAGYTGSVTTDATVPASTPNAVYNSERWSPSDNPRMSWAFPAPDGAPLQVRLYFANRCTCTSAAGQRKFDVSIDGTLQLDDFDIVQNVGDQVGTMRAFDLTSDGTVNIDFGHVVENPLVNAIEIVRTDQAPPPAASNGLSSINFSGTTATGPTAVDDRGVPWSQIRGAFMLGDTLFYAQTDGYFYKRTFTRTTTGSPVQIDPYNDPLWNDAQNGVGGTERGAVPNLYGQISSITGLFYSGDRIYYTRSGDSNLYWRWFNVDSGIIGSQTFTANGGQSWSDTGGLFKSGNTVYVVSRTTGFLSKVAFADGSPTGSPTPVDATRDWRAKVLFIGPGSPPPNQAPSAAFTASCSERTCDVNANGSSDPDGSIASYAWTFGDGGTDTGATASHTYLADDTYSITLTVTDNQGATDSTSRSVTVAATPPPASNVSYVGENMTSRNSTSPSVNVPGAVQAGDQLVLVGSYGLGNAAPGTPPGWTQVATRSNTAMESFVWTRRATAGDAGTTVTTPLSRLTKSALTLTAYRGVASSGAIADIASSADSSTASHTSPTVTAPGGAWVVQVWTDKSSGTTTWTAPSGVTVRGSVFGSNTGRMSALLADSGGPVASGTYGGQEAQTDAASGRAVAWTIALKPGTPGGPANQPPTASFTAGCTGGTCDVNAGASSDPDGSITEYDWTFGDGGTGSGPTTSHNYVASGSYTITLTVTDNSGATGSTTRAVNVTTPPPPPPPASNVSFVGENQNAVNSMNPGVTVPASVQAGDQLVLIGSYGVGGSSPVTPSGWTMVDTRAAQGLDGFVWTRRATAGDAGSTVSTQLTALKKSSLTLTAYRGVAATGSIAAIASSTDGGETQHTSPTVTAPDGAWVIQVWTDKSSTTTSWTAPGGVTVRDTAYGAGGGRVSALLTDSDGPVAAGTVGGQTAQTDAPSGRAIAWTIALTAAP